MKYNTLSVAPSETGEGGKAKYNTIVVGGIELVVPLEMDEGAAKNSKDALRLKEDAGGYLCEIQSSDSGIERVKIGRKKLFLFRFECVPSGRYSIDVRIGYEWYTVLADLLVSERGVFHREEKAENKFEWDETSGGPATEKADKKGASLITTTFWTRRLARVRLGCGGTDGSGNHSRDGFEVEPWLRRLYVLWATPTVSPKIPKYSLFQTDNKGYIQILGNNGRDAHDPSAVDLSLPLFKGAQYLFYFSRWPCARDENHAEDAHFPENMLKTIASFSPENQTGDPQKDFFEHCEKNLGLKPDAYSYSVSLSSTHADTCVILIPEEPDRYIPNGNRKWKIDKYGGWVLFQGMPGGATQIHCLNKNKKPPKKEATEVTQCPAIEKQVRNLQFRLGALRYPVGNQWSPYIPEPPIYLDPGGETAAPSGKPLRPIGDCYPNEGLFDEMTRNAVIAFQEHAFPKTDPALSGCPFAVMDPEIKGMLSGLSQADVGRYVDRAHYTRMVVSEINLSRRFLQVKPPDKGVREKCVRPAVNCHRSVVDQVTGETIQGWLREGLRKPDRIMVNIWKDLDWPIFFPFYHWIREELAYEFEELDKKLIKMGLKEGIYGQSFRDIRVDVKGAAQGRAVPSIHKSGFALDLVMDDYRSGFEKYPLHYVRDEPPLRTSKGVKYLWTVYIKVPLGEIKDEEYKGLAEASFLKKSDGVDARSSYYVNSIDSWQYDFFSDNAGKSNAITLEKEGGFVFLNLTKVLKDKGLKRIPSWTDAMNMQTNKKFQLKDKDGYDDFLKTLNSLFDEQREKRLTQHKDKVMNKGTEYDVFWEQLKGKKLSVNSKVLLVEQAKALHEYLTHWGKSLQGYKPSPGVTIDPKRCNTIALLKSLKEAGIQKARIDVGGGWPVASDYIGAGKAIKILEPSTAEDLFDIYSECKYKIVSTANLDIKKLEELPTNDIFNLYPLVDCGGKEIVLMTNSTIEFDVIPGNPICMEWWHFEYTKEIEKKANAELWYPIGLTREGLVHRDEIKIFGEGGVGYARKIYDGPAPCGSSG